jgi:aminoglycoside phosphotransferase (APT) family kinase protein
MPKGPLISQGRTAEVFAWDEKTVLKLYHPQIPDPWIDQERRIGRFVWEAALPVPAMQGTVREANRTGILWERVNGKSLLHALIHSPFHLGQFARQFADLQVRIHAVEAAELPPVGVWLEQIITHSPFLSPAEKHLLIAQVKILPTGDRLLHMDFHPGNVLDSGEGYKVIDWLLAMRGPEAADIARTLLLLEHHLQPLGMRRFKAWIVRLLLREFSARYRSSRLTRGNATPGEVEKWMLPLAAARLAEPICHEERLSLIRFVRSRLPT